jgi:hypothetical protein
MCAEPSTSLVQREAREPEESALIGMHALCRDMRRDDPHVGVRGCGGRASCGARAKAKALKAALGSVARGHGLWSARYEPPHYANPLSTFLLTLLLLYCLRWRFEDNTAQPEYPLPYVQIKRVSTDICLLILLCSSNRLYISLIMY